MALRKKQRFSKTSGGTTASILNKRKKKTGVSRTTGLQRKQLRRKRSGRTGAGL